MALAKQAKVLTRPQVAAVSAYLASRRNGLRNQVIFLLSVRAGLRAKEIAHLRWSMLVGADGELSDSIHLTDLASKAKSGRIVPLAKDLQRLLAQHFEQARTRRNFDVRSAHVVRTERSDRTSPQAIVNMFARWYADLGLVGCSSHSGRRTFITNAARKIGSVGGSLKDVQELAGHRSLQVTQRYIESDAAARRKVIDLL